MRCVLTEHAKTRIRQRGMKERDVEVIMEYGTLTEKGPMITKKDYAAIEREMKRKLTWLRRLVDKLVITDGADIITVFHTSRAQQRRLLRRKHN